MNQTSTIAHASASPDPSSREEALDEFLTQAEAAEELNLSERTLERWRIEGKGPRFHRFGRLVRYGRRDLKRYVLARSFVSTSEADTATVSCKGEAA